MTKKITNKPIKAKNRIDMFNSVFVFLISIFLIAEIKVLKIQQLLINIIEGSQF